MKIPRDLSGHELAKKLWLYGYAITRQTGSHMRLTTIMNGEHHITVPNHDSLRIGTVSKILGDVAVHFDSSRNEIIEKIFG